jgi:hypothetical protein
MLIKVFLNGHGLNELSHGPVSNVYGSSIARGAFLIETLLDTKEFDIVGLPAPDNGRANYIISTKQTLASAQPTH